MPHASNPSRRAWDLMLAEVKRMLQNQPVAGGAERGRGPQRGSRVGVVAAAPPGAEPRAVTGALGASTPGSPPRGVCAVGWLGGAVRRQDPPQADFVTHSKGPPGRRALV